MKKNIHIILILVIVFSNVFADDLLNLGSISFNSVNWTNDGDLLYGKTNVNTLTSRGQPVAIHFFTSGCN